MSNKKRITLGSYFLNVFLVLNLLIDNVLSNHVSDFPSPNQAFIQTDKELKFMINGVQVNLPPDKFSNFGFDGEKAAANPVRFDPPYLDFSETSIGQPHLEHVTLTNPDSRKVVHLLSISASTPHFHCSFFHDKMVPVNGNTTFDVVFLPREVGNVENTLYIHTSRGTYKYQVFGVGTPSPYRLQPFVGAKIPVNTSFSPYIHVYNPHPYPMQITEMYTSGGDLHLELPNGVRHAPRKHWEIPAYETRTVMRLRMIGRKPANNTAFVRIKTNLTTEKQGFVLPVEVQVSNKPGIYCTLERINFGILRTLDNPKPSKLVIINSSNRTIHITSVTLDRPNDAVSIEFRPMKLLPGIYRQTLIAMLSFSTSKALSVRQWSGNIIVKTREYDRTLTIPYSADVLHGSLEYEANSTKFFTGENCLSVTRKIQITNKFNFTIVIYSVSLQAEGYKYFKLLNFTGPVQIRPQETKEPLLVQFTPPRTPGAASIQMITQIGIFSNASLFVIPLFVYPGKLTVVPHRPELYKGHLDFGTLGVKEKRSLTFTLRNENPVEIHISRMTPNWDQATIELRGIERGKATTLTRTHDTSKLKIYPLTLKPYHYAVYTVTVEAPSSEGVFASDIKVNTQFESLSIPYYMRTAEGSLAATHDPIILENSFPSKLSRAELTVKSTFTDHIELKAVAFQPNDTRFAYRHSPSRQLPRFLYPGTATPVGDLVFDPSQSCADLNDALPTHQGLASTAPLPSTSSSSAASGGGSAGHHRPPLPSVGVPPAAPLPKGSLPPCYVGFSTSKPLGQQWLHGVSLEPSVLEVDQYILSRLLHQWDIVQVADNHVVNVTLLMDANPVRGFLSKVQALLVWPNLVSAPVLGSGMTRGARGQVRLDMGLGQLGNLTVRDVALENPSSKAVLVQVVPLEAYPSPGPLLERLGLVDADFEVDSNSTSSFSVNEAGGNRQLESDFGVRAHRESTSVLLPPGGRHILRVHFRPQDTGRVSSLLLLRNNLTGLETLWVSGVGAQGALLFGSTEPEDTPPLLFELTEKHLRNCDSKQNVQVKGQVPNFTVRRPLVLKNSGHLPIYIHGFSFGPSEAPDPHDWSSPSSTSLPNPSSPQGQHAWCAGYGFEVPGCVPFELGVNQSQKLEIAFTPDFSLHRIQQQLRVYTSLGTVPLNLTVQATLPPHMLYRCSQALARPEIEFLMWYAVVGVTVVLALCIIALAYFEADRIFTQHVLHRQLLMSNPTNQIGASRVFDLRPSALSGTNQNHSFHQQQHNNSSDQSLRPSHISTVDPAFLYLNSCLPDYGNHNSSRRNSTTVPCSNYHDSNYPHQNNSSTGADPTQHQVLTKKRKRGFIQGIYQWVRSVLNFSSQQAALKPKLEATLSNTSGTSSEEQVPAFHVSENGNGKIQHSNHDNKLHNIERATSLTSTIAAANSSTVSTAVHSSSNNTNNSGSSGGKGPRGRQNKSGNNKSSASGGGNGSGSMASRHQQGSRGSGAGLPLVAEGIQGGPQIELPDFEPINIPRRNRNGGGKKGGGGGGGGGGITSPTVSAVVTPMPTSSSVGGSKKHNKKHSASLDDPAIVKAAILRQPEDSLSASTDSSNEEKNLALMEVTNRHRSARIAPMIISAVGGATQLRQTGRLSGRQQKQFPNDGNDAEDEADDDLIQLHFRNQQQQKLQDSVQHGLLSRQGSQEAPRGYHHLHKNNSKPAGGLSMGHYGNQQNVAGAKGRQQAAANRKKMAARRDSDSPNDTARPASRYETASSPPPQSQHPQSRGIEVAPVNPVLPMTLARPTGFFQQHPVPVNHRGQTISIVRPVVQQRSSPISSTESETPLWDDVPLENLAPAEDMETLAAQTENFARYQKFYGQQPPMLFSPTGPPPDLLEPFYPVDPREPTPFGDILIGELQPPPGPTSSWGMGATQGYPGDGGFYSAQHMAHYQNFLAHQKAAGVMSNLPGHIALDVYQQGLDNPNYTTSGGIITSLADNQASHNHASSSSSSSTTVPTSSANSHHFPYELPSMTKDRRQSMLEYERRYNQGDPLPVHPIQQQHGGLCRPFDAAAAALMDPTGPDLTSILGPECQWGGGVWSNQTNLVPPRNPWQDVEPGSVEDPLASNLLPPNLLDSTLPYYDELSRSLAAVTGFPGGPGSLPDPGFWSCGDSFMDTNNGNNGASDAGEQQPANVCEFAPVGCGRGASTSPDDN